MIGVRLCQALAKQHAALRWAAALQTERRHLWTPAQHAFRAVAGGLGPGSMHSSSNSRARTCMAPISCCSRTIVLAVPLPALPSRMALQSTGMAAPTM